MGSAMETAAGRVMEHETEPVVEPAGSGTNRAKRDAIVEVLVPFRVDNSALRQPGISEGRDDQAAQWYAKAIEAEIVANAGQFDDCRAVAVRFGGGVATRLGRGVLDIFRTLKKTLEFAPDISVTIRSCPSDFNGSTTTDFLLTRPARFDMEVMTLDPLAFGSLDRTDSLQNSGLVENGLLRVHEKGRLGYVLAYGYAMDGKADPLASIRRSTHVVTRSACEHVCLERVSPLCKAASSEEVAAAQLAQARTALLEGGFAEYLPLRFARPGREDRFFVLDAKGAERIGFGAGAATLIDGVRSVNTANIELYCEKSSDFEAITATVEQVG